MIDVRLEIPIAPEAMARATPIVAPGGCFAKMVTPGPTRKWQAQVAELARAHMPTGVIDEPLFIDLLFVFPRPKALLRRKDPDGLMLHAQRPDVDNCVKNFLDAMRSFWRDDSLVCDLRARKRIAERDGRARLVVHIKTLGPAAAADASQQPSDGGAGEPRRGGGASARPATLPLFQPPERRVVTDDGSRSSPSSGGGCAVGPSGEHLGQAPTGDCSDAVERHRGPGPASGLLRAPPHTQDMVAGPVPVSRTTP